MEIELQIVAAANATIPFKRVMTAGTMQQVQTLNPGAAPQTACECALKRLIAQQIAAAGVVSMFSGGFEVFVWSKNMDLASPPTPDSFSAAALKLDLRYEKLGKETAFWFRERTLLREH